MESVKKSISELVNSVQSELKDKMGEIEKKIEVSLKTNEDENQLKAKLHAQEIRIKELETQLESKSHAVQNKERVIEMWKAQNKEINLKLVKLVEDKDVQINKFSEQMDSNLLNY